MEETRDDAEPTEQGPSNASWWGSDFMEKFDSITLLSQEDSLSNKESPRSSEEDGLPLQTASQILWNTGILAERIPNGFYSVIPDKKLKELFDSIPTFDELHALGSEGLKADIILVDTKKDKKLSMLKQLIKVLVKGLNSNPAAIIRKIAGLVSDVYKRQSVESPAKAALEETSRVFENRGVQLLGQIKHGSCRPRAILFKVLSDTIGLESRLMVGLPNDRAVESMESYKHMSVIVVLNSVELLVDLMRFPGQLIPRSTRALFMTHISPAGESDSAENDSCDSPLEPNSPLYGFPERVDHDSTERDDNLQFHRRLEASSNVSGPSLRNLMLRSATSIDRKLSLSHSDPDIATTFWRRSRKKVVADQRTASSSPEHPLFQVRGRSILSGDRHSNRDYADDMATSRFLPLLLFIKGTFICRSRTSLQIIIIFLISHMVHMIDSPSGLIS
uniref:EDR1/CTR1/ARMC3-like peptidase-like domain-containing protein n=2 Tax=Rhizophora mucronata TaxID=61149 RepID=A0A2P2M0B6_RHIMU